MSIAESLFSAELAGIVARSIFVSGSATILASSWSVPLALWIGVKEFRGKTAVLNLFNSLVGLPTVVIGLILLFVFARSGPLGPLGLLYTPYAIMIGQAVLITPILVVFIITSISEIKDQIWEAALSLGATGLQALLRILKDASNQVATSMLTGFNRALGELGVALMLGGNLKGFTQVIPTTIALDVAGRGEFELGIALGLVSVAISFLLTSALSLLRG